MKYEFEAVPNAADQAREERDELLGLLQSRNERVADLKLSLDGVKEELRELGVAFEKLQDAAIKAATTLKNFSDAVPQENAEIVANYLESAAGKAR